MVCNGSKSSSVHFRGRLGFNGIRQKFSVIKNRRSKTRINNWRRIALQSSNSSTFEETSTVNLSIVSVLSELNVCIRM